MYNQYFFDRRNTQRKEGLNQLRLATAGPPPQKKKEPEAATPSVGVSGASVQQLGGLKQQLENTLKVAYTKNYSMGLQKGNLQPNRDKEHE